MPVYLGRNHASELTNIPKKPKPKTSTLPLLESVQARFDICNEIAEGYYTATPDDVICGNSNEY